MTVKARQTMTTLLAAYERRLRDGAALLERLESSGRTDQSYDRMLRLWLELLAAYEYEYEVCEQGTGLLAAI
jgi:hypothetical protein